MSTEKKTIVPAPGRSRLGHLVLAILLMAMPLIDAPTPKPTDLLLFNNPFFWTDFILHFLTLLYAYLNYEYLVPNILYGKNVGVYGLVVLSIFTFLCFVPDVLPQIIHSGFLYAADDLEIHTVIQVRHIFFLFLSASMYTITLRIEERRFKIQQALDQAELKFLRAQISPHFLFNTLNSIYALQQVDSERASESIISLSNIMRYLIGVSEDQKVSLGQELNYLDDFIALQKGRFGQTVTIQYSKEVDNPTLNIPPMLFIPFIENAFKYGIYPGRDSEIRIDLRQEGPEICFEIVNHNYAGLVQSVVSTGVGIKNTQKRLMYFFGKNYHLDIQQRSDLFTVTLKIVVK